MKTPASPSPVIRFGVFELDLQSRELRKQGMKIKLQGQPVEILAVLLERPGETIAREELQKRLWPADTFVDFEQGLNNAMKRLRAALDDDADTPRFVETLPRRGYRFVGAVNGRPENGTEPTAMTEEKPDTPEMPARQLGIGARLTATGLLGLVVAAALVLGLNVRGWRDRLFTRHTNPPVQALAVLPLANLSGDPEQEYFADGMTEALITELGKVSKPRVISRQSIMQYKGSKKSLQQIARELNVDAVLEGAVERSGDRVRVSVHLERVSPESQVWANEYSSNIHDVMGLEDDVARAISNEIQVRLTPDERIRLTSSRPVDPEAHDDFLRAEFLVDKRNEGDLQAGIAYFKKAIEKDPAYARAYAGLAWALVNLTGMGTHRTRDVLPQARAAADRALELDPSLSEAHVSRAMVLTVDWNWSEAEKEHRLALTLNPNSWDAHSSYAWYLLILGRFDEARAQIKYVEELDPVSPVSRNLLAYVDVFSGHTDRAIEGFTSTGWDKGLGLAYVQKKMYPEAIAALRRNEGRWGRQPAVLGSLAWVYGLAGRKHEAQRLIDELNEIARHRYVGPALFVSAYLGIGDKDAALTWMERAIEEQDQELISPKVDPSLDPLRSDPRFQALVRRMNFPQ
ncbi:MAG: tetratricopeptide repeat protein [Terriglobales bacterium]